MSMELTDIHEKMMNAISEIDVKLDSLQGGKSSGKRKIVNDLMEKHANVWEQPVNDTVSGIKGLSPEAQVAAYNAFVSQLKKAFDKQATAYVEGVVDNQPVQEPLITEEEAEVLSKKRSELYQKVKSVVELAETVSDEELEMPRIRRGSTGKRGPRNLSLFTFFIDGVEVDETIGNLAKMHGYDKASELTKALRESGFDVTNGDDLPSFPMPDGTTLSGYRDDSEEEEEEEEDPED